MHSMNVIFYYAFAHARTMKTFHYNTYAYTIRHKKIIKNTFTLISPTNIQHTRARTQFI